MYILVSVQEAKSYYKTGPSGLVKARLEEAAGERCLIVPYQEFNMSVVNDLQPRAIVMSGFGGHFQSRQVEWFRGMDEVLHDADLPMLCFCGSHQVLAFSFNKNLRKARKLRDEPIRKIAPLEDLPRRAQGDSKCDLSCYFVAEGFFPITKVKSDPIFRDLPDVMTMRCSHYCEVKKLPADFELLASSQHCKIEAMRHCERPLYGMQFHPEAYEAPFFDGRRLLENFAEIVSEFWKKR